MDHSISHLELIQYLASRRLPEDLYEASFSDMEAAIFGLDERDALDYDMLASVMAPYANCTIDVDEAGGPSENAVGFDVMDLVIGTVCPEVLAELEQMLPNEDDTEEDFDAAWDGFFEYKYAVFFAIMEYHFAVYDVNEVGHYCV